MGLDPHLAVAMEDVISFAVLAEEVADVHREELCLIHKWMFSKQTLLPNLT